MHQSRKSAADSKGLNIGGLKLHPTRSAQKLKKEGFMSWCSERFVLLSKLSCILWKAVCHGKLLP